MNSPFLAYTDRISVVSGDSVELKVSTTVSTFDASVVALRGAELGEDRHVLDVELVTEIPTTTHVGREQSLSLGSYGRVDDDTRLALQSSGALRVFVMPSLLADRHSAVLSRWDVTTRTGWWLGVVDGIATLMLSDGSTCSEIRASRALECHAWYCIAASWDTKSRRAEIAVICAVNPTNSRRSTVCESYESVRGSGPTVAPGLAAAPVCIAASWRSDCGRAEGHFNGKIDHPAIWAEPVDVGSLCNSERKAANHIDPIAEWIFSDAIGGAGVPSEHCEDRGPHRLHATLIGQPTRAVTGVDWIGDEHNFKHAPRQYGAIHFHEDDLDNANWESDVTIRVPPGLQSGPYAFHLSDGAGGEDYFPFWVRPQDEDKRSPALLLFPTATYMAYANDREGMGGDFDEAVVGHTYILTQRDLTVAATPGLGVSLYDTHTDGSGVAYSSRLRPVPNMSPQHRHANGSVWGLPADMHIVGWLNQIGVPFDVATDEDLQRDGAQLLDRYQVVLTGTHPEYCSGTSLDAFESYLGDGGRVMYLGGNGFYWVATPHPEKPHLLEIRRGTSGTRAWESAPGELHHAFTGELGGLWRHRGRAPQKLFGVGFAAEGFDRSCGFLTLSDWQDPGLAWAVAGMTDCAQFGSFGWVGGGAAGHEVDRYDLTLGSPLRAFVLATSAGLHSENYIRAVEEVGFNRVGLTGPEDPMVRADVTLFATPSGGAVFATGSIAWAGALSHNGFDNPVCQLTTNVLRRLLDPAPFEDLENDARPRQQRKQSSRAQ